MTPIIEVLQDDAGNLSYRLRTSLLTTAQYGQLLATLAALIAQMFEQEAGLDVQDVTDEVARAFGKEIDKPSAKYEVRTIN
jgi:hypothetical protein